MKKRSTKKTRSIKRKRTPSQAAEHRAAVQGMLNIAGKLNGSAEKVATKPSWKAWYTAAMVTARTEYLVRSLHEQLTADDHTRGPAATKSVMVLTALGVGTSRQNTDKEALRIGKKNAAIMKRYGKGPHDNWPEGEDVPDDVREIWGEVWDRRVELTADVLREVGEGELADAILADPDAFWTWEQKAHELGAELLPENWEDDVDAVLADIDKRFQAIWTDYFPKTGKDQ